MSKKRIAIFASGSGSNAQNIFEYFSDSEKVIVDSLWANKAEAYALKRAEKYGIESFVFSREQFYQTNEIVETLRNRKVDLIVLAGFLWLIPDNLVENFTIINIHPALLPKYGGKGMYGMNVHKAVIANKEVESGISIHFVNERYDDGKLIFQAKCAVSENDTPEKVAEKVHELEYEHFPRVIETVLFPAK
ncbi:phosphoribosylglycinamide formyltransferase [Prolixibacteraceae bacterium Z1-6]|uniref:Phosphoribosylglycinamide formyltransferase n=1 Tax=Draconibacterium aestuarii TaxID=2998507 RepID=A0A9X3F6C9_9BACT|nr:phosphoribosylglycinamide formyltransferase [Prolixibacteraceae bacterium Z1-6]